MLHKRFYVRLDLQLHAITCPGVWLCSHGYLEATVKTLGYYFRTGAMEPRFPMLCHDQFTMEGYFMRVGCLEDMHELLKAERLEITIWQNGRRLAYFIGSLTDMMHPTVPRLSCSHKSNVQLLMKTTPAFPGILAPKVELSAQLSTQDRKNGCNCSSFRDEPAPAPVTKCHVESRCLGHLEQPRKQQKVCHAKKSNCCPSLSCSVGIEVSPEPHKQEHRRLSICSSSTQLSSLSHSSSLTQCSHLTNSSELTDHHQSCCEICQVYQRLFPAF
ncbi:hypothetical protein KR009_010578 [Drosophila setifemur]|nr:hypothetical protein KR009_010578 [Drosophila setifemur]